MLTHYSRLFPTNQSKLAKLSLFASSATSVPSKALLLSDFPTTVGLVFVDPFGLIQFLTNIVVFNITATSFDVAGNLGDSTTHYHPCSLDGVLEVATILAPPKTCRATYSSHWLCLSHHIGRSIAQLTSPGPRKIGFC
jgi:hypothetical protein